MAFYPRRVAFYADLSTDQNNVTGDGTQFTPLFDNVAQTASDYNSGTGKFTAPVEGYYHISSCLSFINVSASTVHSFSNILLNTNVASFLFDGGPVVVDTSATYAVNFASVLHLNAGDTIQVVAQINGVSKTAGVQGRHNSTPVDIYSYFSAFLIS